MNRASPPPPPSIKPKEKNKPTYRPGVQILLKHEESCWALPWEDISVLLENQNHSVLRLNLPRKARQATQPRLAQGLFPKVRETGQIAQHLGVQRSKPKLRFPWCFSFIFSIISPINNQLHTIHFSRLALFTALCWAILVEAEKQLNKIYSQRSTELCLAWSSN